MMKVKTGSQTMQRFRQEFGKLGNRNMEYRSDTRGLAWNIRWTAHKKDKRIWQEEGNTEGKYIYKGEGDNWTQVRHIGERA